MIQVGKACPDPFEDIGIGLILDGREPFFEQGWNPWW
jgi:hypothetical protein